MKSLVIAFSMDAHVSMEAVYVTNISLNIVFVISHGKDTLKKIYHFLIWDALI